MAMITLAADTVLVLIDLQQGFDHPAWGPSHNPACEPNCERLAHAWLDAHRPLVVVRHDSPLPESPLAAGTDGNALMDFVPAEAADLMVIKQVNSAFYGTPDLHQWLQQHRHGQLVLCGIQTNMCVETTARMAGNLGYSVIVPIDATRTFDLPDPIAGPPATISADDLMRASAASLHHGRFATVTTTDAVLDALVVQDARP